MCVVSFKRFSNLGVLSSLGTRDHFSIKVTSDVQFNVLSGHVLTKAPSRSWFIQAEINR